MPLWSPEPAPIIVPEFTRRSIMPLLRIAALFDELVIVPALFIDIPGPVYIGISVQVSPEPTTVFAVPHVAAEIDSEKKVAASAKLVESNFFIQKVLNN